MKFKDLVDQEELYIALENKWINVRYSDDGQRIYNYSDRAMFTSEAWDIDATSHCRGLIVGPDDSIVARPWRKFWNHNQPQVGELNFDAPVEVTDKMDGSLGIVHLDESGEVRVATRGSFESDQAIWATDWLRSRTEVWNKESLKHLTVLVEIVYPANRIVCDYGDYEGLTLLGAVETEIGDYLGPNSTRVLTHWPWRLTETFEYKTLREALAAEPREGAEGLCVRFRYENKIVKIKQEDYVQLHKLVTGLNERVVWEHAMAGKPLEDLLAPLPDELHSWTREVWDRLGTQAASIENQVIEAHLTILACMPANKMDDRKTYAQYAKKKKGLTAYLFAFKDGKNIRPMILKNIKPSGAVKARVSSEDTA